MNISHKAWICLATPDTLAAAARKVRTSTNTPSHLVKEPFWRQVEFRLDAKGVTLRLMSVDEEAARGGYFSCGYEVVERKMAWTDLDDVEFLRSLIMREQFAVGEQVLQMLGNLKEHRVAIRKNLEEVFAGDQATVFPNRSIVPFAA